MTCRIGRLSADPSLSVISRRRSPSEKIPDSFPLPSIRMTAPLRRLMLLTSCRTWPTVNLIRGHGKVLASPERHGLLDPDQFSPDLAGGMEQREILRAEIPQLHHRQRQRIPQRHHRRGRCTGRQTQGTGLFDFAHGQHDVGRSGQAARSGCRHRDDRMSEFFHQAEKAEDFIALSAGREDQHDVPLADGTQVAVDGVGGGEEMARRAGAGQGWPRACGPHGLLCRRRWSAPIRGKPSTSRTARSNDSSIASVIAATAAASASMTCRANWRGLSLVICHWSLVICRLGDEAVPAMACK